DHRQPAGGARLPQVVVVALEELLVGQHRQACGAAVGVLAGDPGRVEVGADQALAGRGLLDLGDDAGAGAGDAQRTGEAARPVGLRRRPLQLAAGAALRQCRDLLALARKDRFEDVGLGVHAFAPFNCCVTATNCSSFARAAPEASAVRASAMPPAIESATPAAYSAA